MSQLLKFFVTGITSTLVAACAIYDIDTPPPGPTDVWQKSGYTKSQTYSALVKCGQGQIHSDEDLEKRDLCMMRAGFKYIERPTHRMCLPRYPRAWNSSVCRSLRGELIITPDESASLPPPVIKDATAPSACPDYATLGNFWQVAQGKAQGLEPVYPEGWLLDAKAVLDLGKLGVKAVTGSTGKGSLAALKQLRQVDQATALKVVVENNLYKDWPVAADAVSYRVNQLASFATHNPNASTVVLGKYVPDSAVSYEQVAKAQGATYFELPGQSWDNAVE
jgi:hypothetical protein